ncbi:MAG TPA: hypothetical protein VL359_12035, partial [bacterium]|nr:hypothetical protein [bacterium]
MSGRRPAPGRGAAEHQRAQVRAAAQRLLTAFQARPEWQPTLQEAHRALSPRHMPLPTARDALAHLVQSGSLLRVGSRYTLPASAVEPIPKRPGERAGVPPPAPTRPPEGTFVAHPDGFAFVDIPQG